MFPEAKKNPPQPRHPFPNPTALGFLNWRHRVTWDTVRSDLPAGLTNAALVLPQAVAFAAIAGLPPQYGLYTAIVTPIVAALFGSSLFMVSGPATAISAVVFSTLSPLYTPGSAHYIAAALTLTLMVGVIELGFGLSRIGALASFVSHSVMIGFTAAAAVLIGISQLRGALGLHADGGGSAVERFRHVIVAAMHGIDWQAVVIATLTIIVTLITPRLNRRLPAYLIGLVIGTAGASILGLRDLATVGALPSVLPHFSPVVPDLHQIAGLSKGAIALALISLLEAIAIGRAFASRTDTMFSANQEIVAQGMSNIVGSMFQCYTSSGSFTRTGLNYEAGGKTPLASIFGSIGLLVIILLISPLVKYIPIAAMSGLILVVAFRLVKIHEIRHIIASSRSESLVLLATFLVGVLVSLELSILIGVLLSLGFFINRTVKPKLEIRAPDTSLERRTFRDAAVFDLTECPQLLFSRFDGPLYFGSAETLAAEFGRIAEERPEQKFMVVNLNGAGDIDLSGVDTIIKEAARRRRNCGDLYVVVSSIHFLNRLRRLGLNAALGPDHVFEDKHTAIAEIVPRLSRPVCRHCRARIFAECAANCATEDFEELAAAREP